MGALVGTRLREGGHCACASFASSTTEITRSSCGRVELTVVDVRGRPTLVICLVDRCAGACLQAKAGLGDTTWSSVWRHLTDSFFSFSFLLDFGGSGKRQFVKYVCFFVRVRVCVCGERERERERERDWSREGQNKF